MALSDRYRGSLLGLASGDALGTTLEFQKPGTFEPVSDMVGGGPFGLRAGQWTDDTAMALCLAESLVECCGFNAADQMRRYVRWWRMGYLSSTGVCFDIGNTTRAALRRFEETGEPFAGSTDPNTAGNGSLMRLAPVALFYSRQPALAVHYAAESSRTTHGAATAVDACRYFAGLIVGALNGVSKDELLGARYTPAPEALARRPLHPAVAEVAAGSFKRRQPSDVRGLGYVVASLEAALWAFYHTDDFRSGALRAVNLGDDADTTGTVFGQLAGAYYGERSIPPEWRAKLAMREKIEALSERLFELAHHRK
jgi:ADP-ribosylglycohydrolase